MTICSQQFHVDEIAPRHNARGAGESGGGEEGKVGNGNGNEEFQMARRPGVIFGGVAILGEENEDVSGENERGSLSKSFSSSSLQSNESGMPLKLSMVS